MKAETAKRLREAGVECDGWEYHNTLEHFIDDKARERVLEEMGYRVVTFTGHDINRNAGQCAAQAIRILEAA